MHQARDMQRRPARSRHALQYEGSIHVRTVGNVLFHDGKVVAWNFPDSIQRGFEKRSINDLIEYLSVEVLDIESKKLPASDSESSMLGTESFEAMEVTSEPAITPVDISPNMSTDLSSDLVY